MILQFDRPNVSNLEHESQALFTDHDFRSVSVSVVSTDSQCFPGLLLYIFISLYQTTRTTDQIQKITCRLEKYLYKSVEAFFPFVSGADDDVSRTGRISIYILKCSHFSTNTNRCSELPG